MDSRCSKLVDDCNYAVLASRGKDGGIVQSVLWVMRDGEDLLFSTVAGRLKHRLLEADNQASVIVFSLQDPEEYVWFRGPAEIEPDSGSAFSNRISHKYTGADHVESNPANVRIVIRVHPERTFYRPSAPDTPVPAPGE